MPSFAQLKGKWLRGLDLNQRPPGYEPDELPGCSTPQKHHNTQLKFFCKCGLQGCRYSCPTSYEIASGGPLRLRDFALLCTFQVPA